MSALDPKAASERLRAMLDGTFHYTAYRGKAPDGVPTMRADIDVVLSAPPKGQAEAVAVKALDWREEPVLQDLVELAFKDGIRYATNCKVTDIDLAWEHSAVRNALRRRLARSLPAPHNLEKVE